MVEEEISKSQVERIFMTWNGKDVTMHMVPCKWPWIKCWEVTTLCGMQFGLSVMLWWCCGSDWVVICSQFRFSITPVVPRGQFLLQGEWDPWPIDRPWVLQKFAFQSTLRRAFSLRRRFEVPYSRTIGQVFSGFCTSSTSRVYLICHDLSLAQNCFRIGSFQLWPVWYDLMYVIWCDLICLHIPPASKDTLPFLPFGPYEVQEAVRSFLTSEAQAPVVMKQGWCTQLDGELEEVQTILGSLKSGGTESVLFLMIYQKISFAIIHPSQITCSRKAAAKWSFFIT